jgi:hypothetical protein
MALETGGQAFLNGVSAAKIASRVLEDLSCVFLLSFDPGDWPVDQPLPIKVTVRKPGVDVQARGRLVIQSDSSRLTSRLLAAFSTPQVVRGDIPLGIEVIPTGYSEGSFGALVQLLVPGSRYPSAGWDLGASVVAHGQVRENSSAHLEVATAGVPLVLEQEMRFLPGQYQIVAVAHETSTDQIASRQRDGAWPDLRDVFGAVGPIAILQPISGLFHRKGTTQVKGSVARREGEAVPPDSPTAFVTLVCRGELLKGRLRAERRLVGESPVSFSPQDLDLEGASCAQIRDMVPAGAMGAGAFRYEVKMLSGEREVASGERKFAVVGPPKPGGATETPPASEGTSSATP